MVIYQDGGGNRREGNWEGKASRYWQQPEYGFSSVHCKHEYEEPGSENKFSDITSLYLKEMHSLKDERESE